MTRFGVDAAIPTRREADHLVHDLVDRLGLPQDTTACTHLIRTGAAHVALSFHVPQNLDGLTGRLSILAEAEGFGVAAGDIRLGPADLTAGAAHAAAQHAGRRSGRAVIFPYVQTLTGTVAVSVCTPAPPSRRSLYSPATTHPPCTTRSTPATTPAVPDTWGDRRIDQPTPLEIEQLCEQTKAHVITRKNSRGGRSATEHLIAAFRCLYRHAAADGLITDADNPSLRVATRGDIST